MEETGGLLAQGEKKQWRLFLTTLAYKLTEGDVQVHQVASRDDALSTRHVTCSILVDYRPRTWTGPKFRAVLVAAKMEEMF